MIDTGPGQFAQRFPAVAALLDDQDLVALLDALEVQVIVPSEVLITEGSPVDDLFLVWEGQLDVSVALPTGGERSVGQVGVGAYLGEVALLDPGPATATVTAEQGCTALRLSRAAFLRLCDAKPVVAAALLGDLARTLAERLRHGTALLEGSETTPQAARRLVAVHGALHDAVRS